MFGRNEAVVYCLEAVILVIAEFGEVYDEIRGVAQREDELFHITDKVS